MTGPKKIIQATADGGTPNFSEPVDQVERAKAEKQALTDELERIRRLGEIGSENARLRQDVDDINAVIVAVEEWRATMPDRPTQELIAEAMGIPARRLQERLALYPGLWQALTRASK